MKRVLFTHASETEGIEDYYRPLWPAYLTAYIEKHLGKDKFEFRFVSDKLEDELESFKPHILGIGATSMSYNIVKRYASMARRKGISVLVGGIHISYLPETLTEDMEIGCIGEGEETFLELMRHYLRFGSFRTDQLADINGIAYRENGEIKLTPARAMLESLDAIPPPARPLIGYKTREYMFTSRGCPYTCSFCVSARFWQKVRWASPESVVAEVRELVEHGAKIIHFFDDLFTANRKRLRQIANMLVAEGLQKEVSFICYCRSKTVNEEVVESLKMMNVKTVMLGLESGCDRTLEYLKGNVTVKDNEKAVNLLKDGGIRVLASFIIGAPDETEEEIMQTYDFIKNSRLDSVEVGILTPYPGTPVWEYAANRNLVSTGMYWSVLNNVGNTGKIILSERLSAEQLLTCYRKFIRLNLYIKIRSIRNYPYSFKHMFTVAARFFMRNFTHLFSRA